MTNSIYPYIPLRTTKLLLNGTFIATLLLGVLFIAYNGIVYKDWAYEYTWAILVIFAYLIFAHQLLRRGYQQAVNLLLVIFYLVLAFCVLLFAGLSAPLGILAVSFAVLLPGLLMGGASILPVAILSILSLIAVQTLRTERIIAPNLQRASIESTYWDVAIYSTVIAIFTLVSWLTGNQREKGLKRALKAESALRMRKEALTIELEKESSELRLTQLNQIRHLHKFALLGQSTAATLHELSNHLSILNLDIDDIQQQHKNSKAIANTKESINHINRMVRQARQQLNAYDQQKSFNAASVIAQTMKDLSARSTTHKVILKKTVTGSRGAFITTGSPIALMQIIEILLNNAIDASRSAKTPKVVLDLKNKTSELFISVIDNGPGVDPAIAKSLFHPTKSSKPKGLGVGLYIAQHLVKDQFDGTISLQPSESGARFLVTISKRHPTVSRSDT